MTEEEQIARELNIGFDLACDKLTIRNLQSENAFLKRQLERFKKMESEKTKQETK